MQPLRRVATLAVLISLAVLPERGAGAAESAGNPSGTWSAYVDDVFDGTRTLGARYRFGERSAVNFAYRYSNRDYGGGYDDRYQQFTLGYRYLLSEGARRPFADVEVVHGPGVDGPDEFRQFILRASVGVEYFFMPMLSLEGRAGLEYWRTYYEGEETSRQIYLPQIRLALSYHF